MQFSGVIESRGKRRWLALLSQALAAMVVLAVPCFTLIGYGPALTHVLPAEVWAAESSSLGRPLAPADLAPRPAPTAVTHSDVVLLNTWTYTDGPDNTRRFVEQARLSNEERELLRLLRFIERDLNQRFYYHQFEVSCFR